jgi:predicted ArsR family transcriptional regulator
MASSENQGRWQTAAALTEPTRRRMYDAVRQAQGPLTRDEVAERTGADRRLVAFHLDRLAESGLLDVDYARPPGRGGPGAGRPAKRYRVRHTEVTLSVPERRYALAARLLAQGVNRAGGGDPVPAVLQQATEDGHRRGEEARAGGRPRSRRATLARITDLLGELGYEPAADGRNGLRLGNCPFHAVVEAAPEVMCAANEHFVSGLLSGLNGHPDVTARLRPDPPDCCVRITAGGH